VSDNIDTLRREHSRIASRLAQPLDAAERA
jgi:hypothetical protein